MTNAAETRTMTAGEAVVDGLVRNGSIIVLLAGIQNDLFFDALHARMKSAPFINGMNRRSLIWHLARRKRRGSVGIFVVPGPGFLNASAALATAYSTSSRFWHCLAKFHGPRSYNYGLLHEIRDQMGILRTMTKWAERIEKPTEGCRLTQEAFRQLGAGRPVPSGLNVRWMWGCAAPVPLNGPAEETVVDVDIDKVEAAAKMLGAAKNPMIVVGGGAQ